MLPYGAYAVSDYNITTPTVTKLNDTKNILFIHANKLRENDDNSANERQQHFLSSLPLTEDEKKAEGEYIVLHQQQTQTDTTHKTKIYDNSDNNNHGKTSSRVINNEIDMNSVSYTTDLYNNNKLFNYNDSVNPSHSQYSVPVSLTKNAKPAKYTNKKWSKHFLKKYTSNRNDNNNHKHNKNTHRKYAKRNNSNIKHIKLANEYVPFLYKMQYNAESHHRQRRSPQLIATQTNNNNNNNIKKVNNVIMNAENTLSELDENSSIITSTKNDKIDFNFSSNNKTLLKDVYKKNSFDTKAIKSKIINNKSMDSRNEEDDSKRKENNDNDDISSPLDQDETLDDTIVISSTNPSTLDGQIKSKSPRHVIIDDVDLEEPRALSLRPIISGPFEEDPQNDIHIVYAEQRAPVKLTCEVDLDLVSSVWMKDGQVRFFWF